MARVRKLTPTMLRKMVLKERRRLRLKETSDPIAAGIEDPEKASADEVDADAMAGTLEKDIDYIKALKIHEARTKRTLQRIKNAKSRLKRRVLKKL